MKFHYLSIGLVAGLLLCSAAALNVHAQTSTTTATPKGTPHAQTDEETKLLDDTLGGAIAPREQHDVSKYSGDLSDRIANDHGASFTDRDTDKNGKKKKQRPMTLAGSLGKTVEIPNPFAPAHPDNTNKVSFGDAPKMSFAPGMGPPLPALTVDDVKRIAALQRQHIDVNRLTPKMEAEYGLPAGTSEAMNALPGMRIDGMLPTEFTAKSTIDTLMKLVESRQGDSRKKAAEAAYDRLSQMADALRQMKSVPDEIYMKMGVGDAYMKDTKEGYTNGLERVQEALEALDAIKKGDQPE